MGCTGFERDLIEPSICVYVEDSFGVTRAGGKKIEFPAREFLGISAIGIRPKQMNLNFSPRGGGRDDNVPVCARTAKAMKRDLGQKRSFAAGAGIEQGDAASGAAGTGFLDPAKTSIA